MSACRIDPIHQTEKVTVLASPDTIIPWGGRVTPASESWLEEATIQLLGGSKETTNEEKGEN